MQFVGSQSCGEIQAPSESAPSSTSVPAGHSPAQSVASAPERRGSACSAQQVVYLVAREVGAESHMGGLMHHAILREEVFREAFHHTSAMQEEGRSGVLASPKPKSPRFGSFVAAGLVGYEPPSFVADTGRVSTEVIERSATAVKAGVKQVPRSIGAVPHMATRMGGWLAAAPSNMDKNP
eukprot:1095661-Prymnesium_polylepis.2